MKLSKIVSSYFKKHWFLTSLAVLIIILDIALTLLPAFIMQVIVDTIIPSKNINDLLLYALFYMLSYSLMGIFEFLRKLILIQASQGICTSLRKGLLQKIIIMPYETLSSYDTGAIESYFNNDVNTINTLVSNGVISMCIDSFKMIGVFISIFFFKVSVGLLVLAVTPFLLLFIIFVRKRMYTSMLKTKTMEAYVNKQTLETVDNLESIQTYASFKYTENRYEETLASHFKAKNVSLFYNSLFSPVMVFTRYLLIMVILMISYKSPSVFGISTGSFLAISDLIVDLFSPMENIGMELQTLQTSIASIHRINDFLKKPDDMKMNAEANPSKPVLELSHVTYAYQDGTENVISDFSYTLNPGDKLTLKGESGVGKSTLFKLSYGLLKPLKGSVKVNGVPVYELSGPARRSLFGIVYQDCFFSSGSIRDEITLGDSSFSDDDIKKVLKAVGLKRVADINKPLKTEDYSSGELALFNIARIILRKPPIIFLDEMNAKIDPQTANSIIGLLNTYLSSSTILSITHYGTQLINSKELTLYNK